VGFSAVTGLVVVVAVLALATAFGVWRARRDGRLRPVAGHPRPAAAATPAADTSAADPSTTDLSTPIASPAGAVPVGRSLLTAAGPAAIEVGPDSGPVDETLAGLGVDAATPVTLLQFSSAFCAPCRAARRVLGEVADMVDGVRHVEVDAESHLDAVRALDIWRTPTTLVVAGGQVVQRASGVPAKAQVVAAIAPLVEAARDSRAA